MSDQFWKSFFESLAPAVIAFGTLIASIGSLIVSYLNAVKLKDVHREVNGMKHELVAATAKASLAEGTAIGIKEEQDRKGNANANLNSNVNSKAPQEVIVVNNPLPVKPVE